MARSFMGGGAYLTVDMTDLQQTIDMMRGVLKPKEFEHLLHRTFGEVGRRARTIISQEVTEDYAVSRAFVRGQIGHYQLSYGGSSPVTCRIPIRGHKGSIGGRFQASGGYSNIPVQSSIVRSGISQLPDAMRNQGGNPPFRNPQSQRLGGATFTRRTAARLPIVRVVGLGVPQMPLNRSANDVQEQLLAVAGNRLEHNFNHMFLGKGR